MKSTRLGTTAAVLLFVLYGVAVELRAQSSESPTVVQRPRVAADAKSGAEKSLPAVRSRDEFDSL